MIIDRIQMLKLPGGWIKKSESIFKGYDQPTGGPRGNGADHLAHVPLLIRVVSRVKSM